VTAVWGPWHTDVFIRFALPSLLAGGNLPSFRRALDTTYRIHTRRADAHAIRAAPAFQELSRTVRVEIATHADRVLGSPIETHTRIWLGEVEAAKRADGFLGVIAPDIVWADGAFATLAELIGNGKKAFYAVFLRVVSETFLEELGEHRGSSGDAAGALAARALIDMILRHLHPLECAYLRDSPQFPYHAEHVLWPVGDDGVLVRCLANQVLMFHADAYALNRQFSLADVQRSADLAFLTDSDAFAGASLTPLMKDADWYFEPQRADPEEIGAWWLDYEAPAHGALVRQHFRFHAGAAIERAWRTIALRSDFFVTQVLIAREMLRIGRTLKQLGCRRAAELLATALFAARLRRRWRWFGPVSVFAPIDAAFDGPEAARYGRLVSVGAERELIAFIAAHAACGTLADTRSMTTVAGTALSLERAGNRLRVGNRAVLERHELEHGHVVYVIDGVLAR
jgi:hypothetical protein